MPVARMYRAALCGLALTTTFASCVEDSPHALGSALDASTDAADAIDGASPAFPDAAIDVLAPPRLPDAELVEASAPEAGVAMQDSALQALRSALLLPDAWTVLSAAEDPFADRPTAVTCSPAGVMAELLSGERALGVDTGTCHYVTASQPTKRAIAAGETIKVRLWHFELNAPEVAEAHAALLVDGIEVLNERLPIPQPGGLIVRQVRAARAVSIGAQALFHLHNHGANSWALVEVSAGP